MAEKIELTVQWLREQVGNAKVSGLVVGVSGGIDSAVVAGLIKRAFPNQSLGVIMPCSSNPRDREDALRVVHAFGLEHIEIELTEPHGILLHAVNEELKARNAFREEASKLNDGNLRARLRMSTLYAIAGHYRYLVVGTDNAAEVYTGYFTKYGDGGVDLLPITHLKKSEVYEWAKVLGVPQEVLDRPPSAGLWENQTDEEEMGTTYDMIDAHLDGREIPDKDKEIIERLHRISEHKRNMPPTPPKF
ncbi:NAD(+) synthase [Ammoniphilus sp. CFH 90114]|uniref:NAD(+) synthase n=1 Tax=Ammoniphilus sp. CFH 90114 TaxID=2493665 RepID=UPI00100DF0D8|nr:NAD(+) synthase [Ammoniphilus sp. CFH 90114]RXT15491.1 NAD(+) synthase [Ammoniphilus sp. CFH 90114]